PGPPGRPVARRRRDGELRPVAVLRGVRRVRGPHLRAVRARDRLPGPEPHRLRARRGPVPRRPLLCRPRRRRRPHQHRPRLPAV
ncbi:uncharacterized protein METZ01_LOCUS137119, partial [marine metagenome]